MVLNIFYEYWASKVGDVWSGRYKTQIEAAKVYDAYIIKNKLDRPLNF